MQVNFFAENPEVQASPPNMPDCPFLRTHKCLAGRGRRMCVRLRVCVWRVCVSVGVCVNECVCSCARCGWWIYDSVLVSQSEW